MLRAALLVAASALAAQSPFSDYRDEAPGRAHRIKPADLPPPNASEDVANGPSIVKRGEEDVPAAPKGWTVSLLASGLDEPRQIKVAPNGDVFVAESSAGRVSVLRAGKRSVFMKSLREPFGLAFYPPGPEPRYLYIGESDKVVRLPYRLGDLAARGRPEKLLALPGGGHWTRDLAFSPDGKKLFISVGSRSNVSDDAAEKGRANILIAEPDGKGERVFASGLRNPVGLAFEPGTGKLWTAVNERDRLGDDLPPDYVTHVEDGGFYGWPWFYIGGRRDPRHDGKHPELKDKVVVPDVLIQPHSAPLGLAFLDGALYVALHGSWNRSKRTGYSVVRVAGDGYEDFLTGFVRPDGRVWGRPVGVAAAPDGALLVTDDASGCVWRASRAP